MVEGYPPIKPEEVGMALPEESVSWVMSAVLLGMKQDSADNPPRNFPAPPESVSSLRYKNKMGKFCSVCSTFGSWQIGVLDCPPVLIPSAEEKAPIAPPIGSIKRYPYCSPHWSIPRKSVAFSSWG